MTILIIDDFRISNEILTRVFAKMNYQIYSLQNAQSALNILKKQTFDLVITDYLMPEMNGIELMLEIRKIPGYERLPVIILSGIKKINITKEAYEKGVTAWIEKPINSESSQNIINLINKLNIEKKNEKNNFNR